MSYEYVKRFRHKIKETIVKSFGGKCGICGFDKYNEGFDLHHKNPKEKEFAISHWKSLNTSILKEEAKKCVLVCRTCHTGIHVGYYSNPDTKFDSKLFDSLIEKHVKEKTPCLICGTPKAARLKYCSPKCAATAHRKIDWDNIDLVKELSTKCINKVATELKISYNAVKQRCKKLGIKPAVKMR